MGGRHQRLPDLALLTLAVAEDGIDVDILLLHLRAERHAHRDGAALTERAGGRVHAGDLLAVGVALQDAVQLTEILELIAADEAALGQHRVVARGRVALAQHEAVALRHLGVLRINAHVVKKHAHHQLHRREGTTGMAAACIGGHVDDISADGFAYAGKFCRIHGKPPYYKLLLEYRI